MLFFPALFLLDQDYVPLDFDRDGEWDEDDQIGPAIHAPDNVKNIVLDNHRIEWLKLAEPEDDFYAKNNMVATLIFAEAVTINDDEYGSGTAFHGTRL